MNPDEAMERVQTLSERLEQSGDPATRELAEELVASVIELYGAGIERVLELTEAIGEPGERLRELYAEDGVVGSLMLIHDLHPAPLEQRLGEALDSVRPYMEAHGGNVQLVELSGGVATIRLEGSCDGCPASASTLEHAISSAIEAAAPDLEELIVENAEPDPEWARRNELPIVQTVQSGEACPTPEDESGTPLTVIRS